MFSPFVHVFVQVIKEYEAVGIGVFLGECKREFPNVLFRLISHFHIIILIVILLKAARLSVCSSIPVPQAEMIFC